MSPSSILRIIALGMLVWAAFVRIPTMDHKELSFLFAAVASSLSATAFFVVVSHQLLSIGKEERRRRHPIGERLGFLYRPLFRFIEKTAQELEIEGWEACIIVFMGLGVLASLFFAVGLRWPTFIVFSLYLCGLVVWLDSLPVGGEKWRFEKRKHYVLEPVGIEAGKIFLSISVGAGIAGVITKAFMVFQNIHGALVIVPLVYDFIAVSTALLEVSGMSTRLIENTISSAKARNLLIDSVLVCAPLFFFRLPEPGEIKYSAALILSGIEVLLSKSKLGEIFSILLLLFSLGLSWVIVFLLPL